MNLSCFRTFEFRTSLGTSILLLMIVSTSDAEKMYQCMKGSKGDVLCQDADVIPLADKCVLVAVRGFVCGDYDKILMETGKFSDIMVTGNRLVSCVYRMLESSNSTF